jgi:hypothetical protein
MLAGNQQLVGQTTSVHLIRFFFVSVSVISFCGNTPQADNHPRLEFKVAVLDVKQFLIVKQEL